MSRTRNGTYELELKRVAEELRLGSAGNFEDMIVQHCLKRLQAWVAAHGTPPTLSDLADGFAVSLDLSPNPPKDTDGRREDSGRGWVRELQGRWPGVLG